MSEIMGQNQQKVRNWCMVYLKKETKNKLDKLKCYSESYDAAIKRLIYRRNFDVVNNSVVDLEPTTPELEEVNTKVVSIVKEAIKTIGK